MTCTKRCELRLANYPTAMTGAFLSSEVLLRYHLLPAAAKACAEAGLCVLAEATADEAEAAEDASAVATWPPSAG